MRSIDGPDAASDDAQGSASGAAAAPEGGASWEDALLERLSSKRWTLGVVGLGYVGLPLLAAAWRAGLTVRGVDTDPDRVAAIASGRSPVSDVSDVELAAMFLESQVPDSGGTPNPGSAVLSVDVEGLASADVVVIAVPTPLTPAGAPDMSAVLAASEAVASVARPGQLVCLESTVYPGATREALVASLARRGLKVAADAPPGEALGEALGEEVFVAFSPERIDPGSRRPLQTIPKLVGGVSPASTALAVAAYSQLVDEVVPVSSPEVAELAKLLENTYRAVNIALVCEISQVAERLEVSMMEVVEAASTKPFGFAPFWPGPGVGGHCIAVDPDFLLSRAGQLGVQLPLVGRALQANRSQPRRTVERLAALAPSGSLDGVRLLVVGVAYKADVADLRESPALEVARLALASGAEVAVFDPVVGEAAVMAVGLSPAAGLTPGGWDVAAVLCDHSCLDYRAVVAAAPVVFDARGVLRRLGLRSPKVSSW